MLPDDDSILSERAAEVAMRAAILLCRDVKACGTRRRQRSLIARVRDELGTLDFLIGYEAVERDEREALRHA